MVPRLARHAERTHRAVRRSGSRAGSRAATGSGRRRRPRPARPSSARPALGALRTAAPAPESRTGSGRGHGDRPRPPQPTRRAAPGREIELDDVIVAWAEILPELPMATRSAVQTAQPLRLEGEVIVFGVPPNLIDAAKPRFQRAADSIREAFSQRLGRTMKFKIEPADDFTAIGGAVKPGPRRARRAADRRASSRRGRTAVRSGGAHRPDRDRRCRHRRRRGVVAGAARAATRRDGGRGEAPRLSRRRLSAATADADGCGSDVRVLLRCRSVSRVVGRFRIPPATRDRPSRRARHRVQERTPGCNFAAAWRRPHPRSAPAAKVAVAGAGINQMMRQMQQMQADMAAAQEALGRRDRRGVGRAAAW